MIYERTPASPCRFPFLILSLAKEKARAIRLVSLTTRLVLCLSSQCSAVPLPPSDRLRCSRRLKNACPTRPTSFSSNGVVLQTRTPGPTSRVLSRDGRPRRRIPIDRSQIYGARSIADDLARLGARLFTFSFLRVTGRTRLANESRSRTTRLGRGSRRGIYRVRTREVAEFS